MRKNVRAKKEKSLHEITVTRFYLRPMSKREKRATKVKIEGSKIIAPSPVEVSRQRFRVWSGSACPLERGRIVVAANPRSWDAFETDRYR